MKLRYAVALICVMFITSCSPTIEKEVEIGKEIDFFINIPNTTAQFQDGLLAGTNSKLQSVFINYSGETETIFDDNIRAHGDLHDGLICITDSNTGLGGYADVEGKIIIPCQFNYIDIFSEGLAYVMTDSQWGFINKSGEMIIEGLEKYKGCNPFSEGYSSFYDEDGKMGFIDMNGDVVIEPVYDYVRDFQNGLACVTFGDGYWGAINKEGTFVFPLEYSEPVIFSEGLAITKKKNQTIVVNQSGEIISNIDYQTVTGFFSEGLACVKDKEKIGYINTSGELVIPFGEYRIGNDFKDGYALVGIDNEHCGYINKDGEAVTPMDYLLISGDFNENHALAVIDVDNYKAVIIKAVKY